MIEIQLFSLSRVVNHQANFCSHAECNRITFYVLSRGLEFSSYEIESINQVTQFDAIFRVTNPEVFIEIPLSSH